MGKHTLSRFWPADPQKSPRRGSRDRGVVPVKNGFLQPYPVQRPILLEFIPYAATLAVWVKRTARVHFHAPRASSWQRRAGERTGRKQLRLCASSCLGGSFLRSSAAG